MTLLLNGRVSERVFARVFGRISCMAYALCAVVALACVCRSGRSEQQCLAGGALSELTPMVRTFTVSNAPTTQTIVEVRVRVVTTHPWVGDLRCELRDPSGFSVILLDRPGLQGSEGGGSQTDYPGPWGCGGDNIDVWFDDSAASAAETTCPYGQLPALGGALRPLTPLADFRGHRPDGLWTISVTDAQFGDTGSVALLCVDLTLADDCNHNGRADAEDIEVGSSSDVNHDGTPDECECSADLNQDGSVDASDLASVLAAWGSCAACGADLTHDGFVQADDLALLLAQWGACASGRMDDS